MAQGISEILQDLVGDIVIIGLVYFRLRQLFDIGLEGSDPIDERLEVNAVDHDDGILAVCAYIFDR